MKAIENLKNFGYDSLITFLGLFFFIPIFISVNLVDNKAESFKFKTLLSLLSITWIMFIVIMIGR